MRTSRRVLVLDGHTNQALACVRSLGAAGHTVLVASHWHFCLAAWSRHCRGNFKLSGESREAFAALRSWAGGQGVDMVLPMTERACLLCDATRDDWEARGIAVGCAPKEILLRAFDKARTVQFARECDVPMPATRVPGSMQECLAMAQELGFPCVVKDRFSDDWDGNRFLTSTGTRYVSNGVELEEATAPYRDNGRWPILQAFVPGHGKGVFALCDHGRVVAWFAHERLRDVRPSGSGSSLRRSIALDPRLRAPAERLLGRMEWHGPAMVEFRDAGDKSLYVMEVNGRFWNSLQLAIDAGVDFPSLWASILAGDDATAPSDYVQGITLRWIWGDVKRLLYILHGPPAGYPQPYPTVWQGLKELLGRQPPSTRVETWERNDPCPGIGEWIQGFSELLGRVRKSKP